MPVPRWTLTTGTPSDSFTCSPQVDLRVTDSAANGLRQLSSFYVGGGLVVNGDDELGPILHYEEGSSAGQWRCGNHGALAWTQTGTALTAADIGRVWASGADRITLLNVAAGSAVWSYKHDAALTTITDTAPSGTWTGDGAGPDVTFSVAPTSSQHFTWDQTSQSTESWATGAWPVVSRTYTQVVASRLEIARQTEALHRVPVPAELAPTLTQVTTWTWRGAQPGVVFIDVSVAFHVATVVTQWSGLQATRPSGTAPASAIIGVVPADAMVTWSTSNAEVMAYPADWADSIPPSVCVTRRASSAGGIATGLLSASRDRGDLRVAARVKNGKVYPYAVDAGHGTQAAGSTITASGFRSVTAVDHDRHLHVVTDPATGVTHWWLMAGSTGTTTHPQMAHLPGATLTQTRGTATVAPVADAAGMVTVAGAGWAQGTLTAGILTVRASDPNTMAVTATGALNISGPGS